VDLLKHKYYDLLYCFHTTKHNYRKAASVMYEYGLRLGREAPGTKSLKKQADCYCMCLTALHLAQPRYAWVVVPVELEEIIEKNTKKAQTRKRPHPSEGYQSPLLFYPCFMLFSHPYKTPTLHVFYTAETHQQVQVEVRTISDIEKDYSLVRTKLSLLRREPSLTTQICSPFVSPEEVVARLVQVGLFDKAVDTALSFELPLESIFEALASRCVHLSSNLMTYRDEVEDETWNWLGVNESIDIPNPIEKSVVDKAWLMLKSYLETHDPTHDYKLQKCVGRKLLSLGCHLPQWLVQSFKVWRNL
jgi:nuclear pore complex protein Nup160